MQMLVEETLDFLLIYIAHFLGRHGDYIAVLVGTFAGEGVDGGDVREVVVEDAETRELFGGDWAAGVVEETLVALERELVKEEDGGGWRRGGGGEVRL